MDATQFDTLVRSLSRGASRRGLLAGLASGLLAVLSLGSSGEDAEGKKKRKRRNKKNPAPSGSSPSPPPSPLPSPPSPCTPNCSGKICGANDGCGAPCNTGSCPPPFSCQTGGFCNCSPGTLFCGSQCLSESCSGGNTRDPSDCVCCRPTGSNCADFTRCCSEICDTTQEPPGVPDSPLATLVGSARSVKAGSAAAASVRSRSRYCADQGSKCRLCHRPGAKRGITRDYRLPLPLEGSLGH